MRQAKFLLSFRSDPCKDRKETSTNICKQIRVKCQRMRRAAVTIQGAAYFRGWGPRVTKWSEKAALDLIQRIRLESVP